MNDTLPNVEHVKNQLIDLAIAFGPRLLAALAIIAVGVLVSRWVGEWLTRGLARIELEPPVRLLLTRVGRLLVMLLFVIMALQNLGVELLPLIAGLGIAGAGVALAMQGVLSNVAAGLTIIFTKPFRVGEYISIVHEEGRVDVITLFSTTLSHADHSRIVIPNRKIVGEILHNYGTIRQLDVSVGIAYDADLAAALATVNEVLQQNGRVLRDPPPVIQATQLGEWSVSIGVRPWVAVPDYGPATGEINQSIITAFRARSIEIPFPRHDVHLVRHAAEAAAEAH
jgi:small conductance mechanosensitive channel